MTKVKICGLMEMEHVKVAVEVGADAIGFVFAPSKRRITVEKAKELAQSIPSSVLKVGIFVDESSEEIERTFHEVPLDYVQYHGDEAPEFIKKIGLPSIKALAIQRSEDVGSAKRFDVDYFLFDTPGKDYKGGSGERFDWRLVQDVTIPLDKRILAGGLNADNVGEAIRQVKPYMVDVSSGVERNGEKDMQLIRAFVRAVKDEER
ncbi:phosphoribosylanthranilate isomerase [Filibacter tadaridae]|uniref:N-(5'-phosphoribosyl)anthranilate isomerase n=1 Tax=Filibacter tadaridae TaxID=2483811 RepID=A0A3P5WJF8_9BACL|nr:phosphoribosylanthranilate isomerase [Filibacter tadaridae]VDC21635.1 N-(5'-phosphoribosyl)anthranilate isomerase [Filibacter tadaridae]